MSGSTYRSAPTGRHRRPARAGAPSTTPYGYDAIGAAGSDRAEPNRPSDAPESRGRTRTARSVRVAGAGVGVAIAGVVLGAIAPAAAQAAEGLNPQQEDRLRTAEREYRADVNHDHDLTKAEKECMRDASWARVRAMDTPAATAKVRPQQHDACRLAVSLPGGTANASIADLPPTFVVPGDPRSPFKSGAQLSRERALVLNEKLDDMYQFDQAKAGFADPLREFFDPEPDVYPTNPFKPIQMFP